jgi:hypothetical protein
MKPAHLIGQLQVNEKTLMSFFAGMSTDQVRWKPEPRRWSMLEVLNHLCDEERDDFRKRLCLLLEDPRKEWPAIDPEGWVTERGYNGRALETSLEEFRKERAISLQWLRDLESPSWDSPYEHSSIGRIGAGDLLASWVAHDFLHIRQLSNICIAHVSAAAEPFSIRYASP